VSRESGDDTFEKKLPRELAPASNKGRQPRELTSYSSLAMMSDLDGRQSSEARADGESTWV
jgi:hypothetical protein